MMNFDTIKEPLTWATFCDACGERMAEHCTEVGAYCGPCYDWIIDVKEGRYDYGRCDDGRCSDA